MNERREHTAGPTPASNPAARRGGACWLEACRRAAGARGAGEALEGILRSAVEATGAERGFLVTSRAGTPDDARVESAVSLRPDGSRAPSQTVFARALVAEHAFACLDVLRDGALRAGGSVRALSLRSVLCTRVPLPPPPRAALVLDSRFRAEGPREGLLEALEGFAALAALVLAIGGGPVLRVAGPAPEEGPVVDFVGRSPACLELLAQADRVARTGLPVALIGESGTGKEVLARRIHSASPRRAAPLLAVNCAALPESLLESEMFGASRGAYTGADRDRPGLLRLAHGGTLLLDEIGDMPLALQAKLLRVLQDGRVRPLGGRAETSVDVRVLAATHTDLGQLVGSGRFRADLYYRIAVIELRVPPLRERPEDVPLLAEHLLARLARAPGLPAGRPTPGALARLAAQPWPGNIRELERVLARALLRSPSGAITESDLDLGPGLAPRVEVGVPLERSMIELALGEAGGVVSRAAAKIGWSRQKLQRRMAALGVPRPPAARDAG